MSLAVDRLHSTFFRKSDVTRLSVNINKVAVLRNSRGGLLPDPLQAARVALASGCHGITVHPRPDQRHIRADDVLRLPEVLGGAELNIEGNPFAAPRSGYPGLLELVRLTQPAQVTLVPDGDGQLTSDHGFDLDAECSELARLIEQFKRQDCRVSLFVDPGMRQLSRAAQLGADCIEIYTGPYAAAHARGGYAQALSACAATATDAIAAGLQVNAGHDLDQGNLDCLLKAIPELSEVSIGHALFAEALYEGLSTTVKRYLGLLGHCRNRGNAPGR